MGTPSKSSNLLISRPTANGESWAQEGLHLVDYLPDDSYYAVIDQQFDLNQITDQIITIIDVADFFKVEAALQNRPMPEDISTPVKLVISYYEGLDIAQITADLEGQGVIIEAHRDYSRQLDITVRADQVSTITALPYIQFVGPEPEPYVLEPYYRNASGRANYVNTNFNGLNYNGDGVVIAIGEGGILDHIDFQGRLTELATGSASSHKLGVAQYAGGGGNLDADNQNSAWGADILSTSGTPDYAALYTSHDLRFINHSYGTGIGGGYNSTARNHDLRTAAYPQQLVVYSSGNSGGSTGFSPYNGFSGWANITGAMKQNKNHFAVGSLLPDDSIANFSSRGPMYDGRIIPQIIIEGGGGTSHAAPKITGLFAILSQIYQDLNGGTEPPATLLRAVMMNTADEVDLPGPDFKSGYGHPNMRRAYNVLTNTQYLSDTVSNGITNTHTIMVPASTDQLRVMIVWADEAAAVNASTAIVNNLDLLLTDPTATTSYHPWVLDHTADVVALNTPATRQIDSLNTIEQVTIDSPAAGSWAIDVAGTNVPLGPQTYYLVYEFLTDELHMASPLENDRFVSGDTYQLKWDSYGVVTGTFTLDYQLDGGSWVNIVTGHDADSRNYTWEAPAVGTGIHTIKFRVQRGAFTAESGLNYIGDPPENLILDWACDDTAQLSWSAVTGATSYKLYRLGAKYMEEVTSGLTIVGETAIISGLSTTEDEHFAVSVLTGVNESIRTDTITKAAGDFRCFNVKTTIATEIDTSTIILNGLVNPHTTTLTDVHFEYGPTAAYGSSTPNISISATGHTEETVSSLIPSTLASRSDVLHYRLVVTQDGIDQFGADQEIRLAPGHTLDFDGVDDDINLGSATQVTGAAARTIAGWAYAESFNNGGLFQAGRSGTTAADFTLRVSNSNDQWRGQFWGAGTFTANLPGSRNAWHHYALTYDGTTVRLYYDGELISSVATALNTLGNDLTIGQWDGTYFNGQIDEVSYWSKALSAAEIQAMMHQSLDGDEANLVHYLTTDGEPDTLIDLVTMREFPINGGGGKVASSAPLGTGSEFVATEAAGVVDFTGTAVSADYNSQNGSTILAAKIALEPNTTSGITTTNTTIFDNQYWVIHHHGTPSFSANMTFTVTEDLTAADASAPAQIHLYGRDRGSNGDWQFVASAVHVDETNEKATFNNITAFDQQFIVIRDISPFIVSSISSLPFYDMKSNGSTQQHGYTLIGNNLTHNVVVTSSTGFLISTDANSGFVSELTLPHVGGALSETIYVQHTSAAAGTVSGNVVNSSDGLTAETVLISSFDLVDIATDASNMIDFDGSNDYLDVQNFDWNPNSVFTVEWWINPDGRANYDQQIGNNWGVFRFSTNSAGTVNAGIDSGSNSRIIVADALDLNVWQHFAYTIDGTHAKLYKNGQLIGEKTGSDRMDTDWGHFAIGLNGGNTVNGQLDEFRIWSTARTEQEIRDNMHNVLAGNESELELYLQFNESSGDVIDFSDNGYEVLRYNSPSRVISTAAVGTVGEFVNTQTETAVGDSGKAFSTTLTSTPSTTDYIGIYRTGDGNNAVSSETFPAGVTWRPDIFWGVQEFGAVTADLVIDYSVIPNISDPSAIKLLKRTDVTQDWADVTADFVHDTINRTFTKSGETGFSEFAIGAALTAIGDIYNMPAGQVLHLPANGILSNDLGAAVAATAVLDTPPISGTLVLTSDGSFTYTPPITFSGAISFTYHANESASDSNITTVTINVVQAAMSLTQGGGSNVALSWTLSPAIGCQYDIYRSDQPYSGFSRIEENWASSPYTDANGAMGDINTNYFYYVEMVNCPGITPIAPPSNKIGEFDFALTPG